MTTMGILVLKQISQADKTAKAANANKADNAARQVTQLMLFSVTFLAKIVTFLL